MLTALGSFWFKHEKVFLYKFKFSTQLGIKSILISRFPQPFRIGLHLIMRLFDQSDFIATMLVVSYSTV